MSTSSCFVAAGTGDGFELGQIGRQQGRAPIAVELAALGVDQHRLAGGAGQLDAAPRPRASAFLIVGQHHDVGFRQMGGEALLQRARFEAGEAVLEIQPQQLLVAAQHPQLGDRRLAGLPDQLAVGAQSLQLGFQHRRRFIGAGHAQHPDLTAEGGDVDRHVGRAAGAFLYLLDLDHRHGRFRRNPRAGTVPVAVQHHIAGDQHPGLFERRNLRFHGLIGECYATAA